MTTDPLPCPFCGTPADKTGNLTHAFARCYCCGTGWWMVEDWNRRPPSPAFVAMREALRHAHYMLNPPKGKEAYEAWVMYNAEHGKTLVAEALALAEKEHPQT